MVYNTSAINATDSLLSYFQEINNLTEPVKILGTGWSIVLFIIIFFYVLYSTNDFRKALLGSGSGAFLISGLFFMAMKLVDWWIIIAYLVIAIVGLILLFDQDQST